MCGIAGGIWFTPEAALDPTILAEMCRVIQHRGPDDHGTHCEPLRQTGGDPVPGVGLGFQRLSIIDLASGHQPLANEDETVWIAFNGEIYNYQDLRRRLEGSGHRFRTESDTETIVHLYEDLGTECFNLLNGMFAIAIWDRKRKQLVLARDRFGKKPLVYSHFRNRVLFGSELKSLLAHPEVVREIDPNAVDEYLTYQYVPHPHTIFRGIKKLPPGHIAVIKNDSVQIEPYWKPNWNNEQNLSLPDAKGKLNELFLSAVQLRMRSDVPLGAFLSGGIDSSLVVAAMQSMSEQPIKTFSIGFSEKAYDETRFAKLVANHLKTEHREFVVTPNAVEILDQLIWHYDEPFADSSAIPTWYVSKMTREHVTVALSGDGGDELFAGYSRYAAVRLGDRIDRIPGAKQLLGAKFWQSLPGGGTQRSLTRKWKRFTEALGKDPLARYLDWISIFNESRRAELYSDDFLAKLENSDPLKFVESYWSLSRNRDVVTRTCLTDLQTYLPCDLMTKVDIASMAHSLECRAPFLDYRLAEFAASLPISMKLRGRATKWLLRETFGNMLPPEIWRRSKMGFGVPLAQWFRKDLRDLANDSLRNARLASQGMFRQAAINQLLDQHQEAKFDHSYRLWALLVLELWYRKWGNG